MNLKPVNSFQVTCSGSELKAIHTALDFLYKQLRRDKAPSEKIDFVCDIVDKIQQQTGALMIEKKETYNFMATASGMLTIKGALDVFVAWSGLNSNTDVLRLQIQLTGKHFE